MLRDLSPPPLPSKNDHWIKILNNGERARPSIIWSPSWAIVPPWRLSRHLLPSFGNLIRLFFLYSKSLDKRFRHKAYRSLRRLTYYPSANIHRQKPRTRIKNKETAVHNQKACNDKRGVKSSGSANANRTLFCMMIIMSNCYFQFSWFLDIQQDEDDVEQILQSYKSPRWFPNKGGNSF